MKEFARAILSDREDQLTCADCKARLPEIIEAEVMGTDPREDLDEVQWHLTTCPNCAREYRELRALAASAYSQDLPEPSRRVRFDFSFLEPLSEEIQVWQQSTEGIRRLLAEIPIAVSQLAASFGQVHPALVPCRLTVAAGALRSGLPAAEGVEGVIEVMELPDAEANLVIKLSMGPVRNRKGTLVLGVDRIKPAEPIPQDRITLLDEDHKMLESQPTAEDGTAVFGDLETGKYVVQVEHNGRTWEFAVRLAPQSSSP